MGAQTHAALKPYLAPIALRELPRGRCRRPGAVAYRSRTLPKLRELKKKYDPDNFFRQNVNIAPRNFEARGQRPEATGKEFSG